jgi:hypothetical protein
MRVSRGTVLVGLTLATALAMGGSIRNGFVDDDVPIIVQNPHVTDPSHWHEIPATTYWISTLWRPLTITGFALEWRATNGAAWCFHLVSLALYLLAGVLLVLLMERLGMRTGVTLLAGLAFMVHPVHVEVVANIVGQSELLATISLLAATLLYLRARRQPTVWALPTLLLAVTAGILAKEQGFVAPVLLLGAEWLLTSGCTDAPRDRLRYLIPVWAVAALMLVVRSTVTGSLAGETPAAALVPLGIGGRLLTFLRTVPAYARLLVWPVHLQAEYGPPGLHVGGPLTAMHLLGIALIALVVAIFAAFRYRKPAVAFGLWWAAVTLAPVANILAPTGLIMAERVFFLPTVGLAIALAGVIDAWQWPVWPRVAGLALAALWIVGVTVRSALRVPVWRTQAGFFTQLTVDAPASYYAFFVAGTYWRSAAQPAKAEADLRHALLLEPSDTRVHMMLGQLLRENRHCDAAIPVYASGLALDAQEAILRAGLIECEIVEKQWSAAERDARNGMALGQSGFATSLDRIHRAEETTP